MKGFKLRNIFNVKNSPGIVIVLLLIIYAGSNFTHRNWKQDVGPERGVIKWDVILQYSYLPATFIYHDLSLDFTDDPEFVNDNKFWFQSLESGNKLIVKTMGMSYLYAPFFFMAHILAPMLGQSSDGFSSIYQFFLVFGSLFYLGLGFYCLRKLLSYWFSPRVIALTIGLIGIGTNLYNYSSFESATAHSYLFALICMLLLAVKRWYEDPGRKASLVLGLLTGLIVLIRPLNLLLLLPLLFWGVASSDALIERGRFLVKSAPFLGLVFIGFLIPWIPQLIYWKVITGQFIYMAYTDLEGSFYLGNPHIMDFLFSFRKGWFVYTPLMLLGIFGFIPLFRINRGLFYPLLGFIIILIYVLSSWWNWWYGGGFGMRPMLDYYGLLAIPLAALISLTEKKTARKRVLISILPVLFVFVNVFQTFQYKAVLIHWDGMTKESYKTIFLRSKDRYGYWQNLTRADTDLAQKGIYVYYPVLEKDHELKHMPEDAGRLWLADEIRKNRRLIKDIRRYSRRSGENRQKALDMVIDSVYENLSE